MRLYDKTFKHQNREAKIIALASLLFGGLFYGFGNSRLFPMPVLFQAAGLSLIVYSVFVATAYLLKEYRVSIEKNDKKERTDSFKSVRSLPSGSCGKSEYFDYAQNKQMQRIKSVIAQLQSFAVIPLPAPVEPDGDKCQQSETLPGEEMHFSPKRYFVGKTAQHFEVDIP